MTDWDGYADDETPPFADPNIRIEYEAALGRLILAHNEVDFRLGKALKRVVDRLAPDGSLNCYAGGNFYTRLRHLELFQKTAPMSGVVNLDIAKLKGLNEIRNKVAHGHFDQNLYDGSFRQVDAQKNERQPQRYSILQLDQATADLKTIARTLQAHESFGDFGPDL